MNLPTAATTIHFMQNCKKTSFHNKIQLFSYLNFCIYNTVIVLKNQIFSISDEFLTNLSTSTPKLMRFFP